MHAGEMVTWVKVFREICLHITDINNYTCITDFITPVMKRVLIHGEDVYITRIFQVILDDKTHGYFFHFSFSSL